jgi:hypothetical protein
MLSPEPSNMTRFFQVRGDPLLDMTPHDLTKYDMS